MLLKRFCGPVLFFTLSASALAQTPAPIDIDSRAPATPFPHFWEKAFGSGRAVLALRESYRNDVRELKKVADFQYVRFHAIFHDEVGVYDEDDKGNPVYNFSYVDQIYDGLLANGVRPFVEISFMPKKLALRQDVHPFWYKQIVAPPKDYAKWDALIHAFAHHLVERYGIDEVSQWYFEVWNEPNIDFWTGEPKQATYFELYDHTARTLKAVNPRLRVGGPSTAAADWVHAVPRNTSPKKTFPSISFPPTATPTTRSKTCSTRKKTSRCSSACAVRSAKCTTRSRRPRKPTLPLDVDRVERALLRRRIQGARHRPMWAPALADDIRQCDGLVDILSYWTFDDVFEENGVVREPFYGGFGTIAAGGIKKPSFYAYALLHKLGEERLTNDAKYVLVTRRKDGTLVIAAWNAVDPDKKGQPQIFHVAIQGY